MSSKVEINSKSLAYSFIGLGIILRLIEYFHNKSLWLDETFVALNVINNSFLELFNPPDLEHQAPILFLQIEKLLTILFGTGEHSLKLYPLLCGIGSLFLFYKVSKHFLEKQAVAFAMFLFSTCYALIHYSAEVKPYMGDVFWGLLVYLTALNLIKKKITIKDMGLFAILGMTIIWAAYSSVFVLAGTGLTILFVKYKEKDFEEIKKYIAIFTLWAISFFGFYYVSLNQAVNERYVVDVFTQFYVPRPFGIDSITWLWKMFIYFIKYLPIHEIVVFFMLIGTISFIRNDSKKLLFLILPIPFAIFASYLHQYPLWQRCLLFTIPCIFILTSQGVASLYCVLKKMFDSSGKVAAIVLTFFLVLIPVVSTGFNTIKPRSNQEVRDSLKYLKNNIKEGDTIYLHKHLQYGYKYYAPRVGLVELEELESPLENENIKRVYNTNDYTLIVGKSYRYNKGDTIYYEDLREDIQQLNGKKRVWVFLSNMKNRCYKESLFYVEYLNKHGKQISKFEDQGMEVYLYDLS